MTFALTAKDLKNGTLRKVGEPTDGSSIYDLDVVDLLNRAQLKVLTGGNEFVPELARPWAWAISPTKFIIELQPPYNIGGVTVTNGSANITFDTPPTFSMAGWQFRVIGRPEWFKILTHVGGAGAATIDCPYTDVSAAGLQFLAAQFEYNFNPTGGAIRIVAPIVVYRVQDGEGDSEQKIYMTDESVMMKDWNMAIIQQRTPTRFCVVSQDELGNSILRFNSFVLYTTKIEVSYIPYPAKLIGLPTNPFYATVTIASPAVWTKVDHGLVNDDPVVLSTTGALPTGFTIGTTYYIVNATENTFELAATVGGAAINSSGVQSGVHTVTPAQPADYSVLPNGHTEILEYIAAHWLCVIKNDDRMQYYEGKAVMAGKALIAAYQKERTESSKDRGKLIARQDLFFRGKKYVSQEVTPGTT